MTISQGPLSLSAAVSFSPEKGDDISVDAIPDIGRQLKTELPEQERYLVVSPYIEQEHLLDLESLDVENQLLAIALTRLMCLRSDYATAPYLETFNWAEIVETVKALAHERTHKWKETSFFIVAFRSQIPPTTVYAELGALDKAAHAEATASDTGSVRRMLKVATLRHVSGGPRKMQREVEQGLRTAKRQDLPDRYTRLGK